MQLKADWLPAWIRDLFLRKALKDKLNEIEELAGHIRNNKHLKELLLKARGDARRAIYEQWKPHLKFKPKPYNLLFK